ASWAARRRASWAARRRASWAARRGADSEPGRRHFDRVGCPPMADAPRRTELDRELENACLRALATEYDQLNYDLFNDLLRRPELRLGEGRSRLGTWETNPPTITLARQLVLERPWGVLVEVLKHEMAHQFVNQVLRVDEPPHGPAFAQVCRERG